ncbi:hypothetical protein HYH03_007041 [Edaphochlamys debaryana]|uniref:Uncharacterized protein n=1 Tax=Edaphochlamys debaryana TaxID=47281 RepID=A0A835Y4X7_9CHLO|nr:hypothetical protein HYH03_007041 [Edaphochlamys debaryana]|eukprot:KAG2494798.1 hypothetical protein HYH03_007041 [Edaphochlamys debaryana]
MLHPIATLAGCQERRKRQLVVGELLAQSQRHEHDQQGRERSERGKANARANTQGAASNDHQPAETARPAGEASMELAAQRRSAASALSRPQLQALAHLRRCAPTATALSARGRRSGVGCILAAASGAGGGGGGPPSTLVRAGPALACGSGWCKRLPWPQPARATAVSASKAAAAAPHLSCLTSRGSPWGPFAWRPSSEDLPAIPTSIAQAHLPRRSPPPQQPPCTYPHALDDLTIACARLCDRSRDDPAWLRRSRADAALLKGARHLAHRAAALFRGCSAEEAEHLVAGCLASAEAALESERARLECVLGGLGLEGADAAWQLCWGLECVALVELAEALRPGLLRSSAAWEALAEWARSAEVEGPTAEVPVRVLRAAVTGLLLLHGIPSAALEPWGGEGQGPEPLACAGVAMLSGLLKHQPASSAPVLLHFALCHGPMEAVRGRAPPPRYSGPHVRQLAAELAAGGPAIFKEAELLRALTAVELCRCAAAAAAPAAPPELRLPKPEELRALALEAAALEYAFAFASGKNSADGNPGSDPSRPLADTAGFGLDHSVAGLGAGGRWGAAASATDRSREAAEMGPGRAEGGAHAAGPGPSTSAAAAAAASDPAAGSASAPSGPRCCLFDALFWPAGRSSGAAACHAPGAASAGAGASAAVNGAATTPDAPEPWEAELPWLAWLGRQGLLQELQDDFRDGGGGAPNAGLASTNNLEHALEVALDAAERFAAAEEAAGGRLVAQSASECRAARARAEVEDRAADEGLRRAPGLHVLLEGLSRGELGPPHLPRVAEELVPGLLQAQPHTWGRLLRGPELEEGEPHAVQAAHLAVLGLLTFILDATIPRSSINLGFCAAAGWQIRACYVGTRSAAGPTAAAAGSGPPYEAQPSWASAHRQGADLICCLHMLLPLKSVAPRPTWTCLPPRPAPGSGSSGPAPEQQQHHHHNQQCRARAVAHLVGTFQAAPELLNSLRKAAAAVMDLRMDLAHAGPDGATAAAPEVLCGLAHAQEAVRDLACQALESMDPRARQRVRHRVVHDALAAAAASDFEIVSGPAWAPPEHPLAARALAAPAPAGCDVARPQAQAQQPQAQQAQAQAPPCYGPGSDAREPLRALLRVAGASGAWWSEGVTALPEGARPPPATLAVQGPAHTALALMLIRELTVFDSRGVFRHALLFQPEILGSDAPAAAAGHGPAAGAARGGRARPPKSADRGCARVLLKDVQEGCLPLEHGEHKDAYPWLLMRHYVTKITNSSAYGRARSHHLAVVRPALLDMGWGAVWVSGCGVEGVQGALLLAAEIRQEMLAAGRDCCVAVAELCFQESDTLAREAARDEAGAGARAGARAEPARGRRQSSSARLSTAAAAASAGREEGKGSPSAQPAAQPTVPSEAASSALTSLALSICRRRDVGLFDQISPGDEGLPCTAANVEAKVAEAESELLGLLSPGPGGCGPLREGVLVQLRIMECAPGRPAELVLPDMWRHRAALEDLQRRIAASGQARSGAAGGGRAAAGRR